MIRFDLRKIRKSIIKEIVGHKNGQEVNAVLGELIYTGWAKKNRTIFKCV